MVNILQRWRGLTAAGRARLWLAAAACVLVWIVIDCRKPWEVDLSAGRELKVGDYVALFFWPAALGNLVLAGLLAWTAPFWASAPQALAVGLRPLRPRWFWPALIAAAVVVGACAVPRMGHSLWHDEASRTKRTMAGDYRQKDDGSYRFRPVKWERALFDSELPNHVLQSALSKACHDVWTAVARPQGFRISEVALRVPSLVAGVAGVLLLGVLMRALGSPGAGVAAAWLLALHPWYLRYATEARGYAIVMALLPLVILGFLRGVQTGRAGWWWLFGTCQFGIIYAYVAAVYIPLVLNAGALLVFAALLRRGLPVGSSFKKWVVANVISAAVFVQMFLPNVPQLLAYVASPKGQGLGNVMNDVWMRNVLAQLWTGVPWTNSFAVQGDYIEMLPQWAAAAPLVAGAAVVTACLLALGVVQAVRLGVFGALAAAVFLLPALVYVAETLLRKGFIYEWYVIYAVPGLVALVCWGGALLAGVPRGRGGRVAVGALLCALAAGYVVWTQPQRSWLMTNSIHPYREAVLAARPSVDPNAGGQANILTAFVHAGPLVYDPRIARCHSIGEIERLVRAADESGKSLFFILGYLDTTTLDHPAKYRLIASSGLFEEAAFCRGFLPSLSLKVFRYKPGAARGFDFSAWPDDLPSAKGWMNYH